jgi:hypothetical protein
MPLRLHFVSATLVAGFEEVAQAAVLVILTVFACLIWYTVFVTRLIGTKDVQKAEALCERRADSQAPTFARASRATGEAASERVAVTARVVFVGRSKVWSSLAVVAEILVDSSGMLAPLARQLQRTSV